MFARDASRCAEQAVILKTGIDLIEIDRLAAAIRRHGRRFLERVFTPQELADAAGRSDSLAVRFAAKEAVSKALGCGFGLIAWQEVEIRRGPQGEPVLKLYGKAASMAEAQGIESWSISLSHTHRYAVAMVIGVTGG